ncbi:MAG TPA: GerMN domain-containing protein [Terriglobales bacterium]|nr:GerMN domain-containing protein [Terriglobales bacterium]
MPRLWKIAIALLMLLVFAALLTFPSLLRSVLGLRRADRSEEQARRAIVPPISTPTDTLEKAQLFWLSASSPDMLEATTVELDLSANAEERAKQLITALIEKTPSQSQRTLPAGAVLLQFYLMPDGTAIADFSEALETETPSGILNEEMAVDSIVRTLGANLSNVHRLKILVRGQDAETLAGHLDLSEFFNVTSQAQPQTPAAKTATEDEPIATNPLPANMAREQQRPIGN